MKGFANQRIHFRSCSPFGSIVLCTWTFMCINRVFALAHASVFVVVYIVNIWFKYSISNTYCVKDIPANSYATPNYVCLVDSRQEIRGVESQEGDLSLITIWDSFHFILLVSLFLFLWKAKWYSTFLSTSELKVMLVMAGHRPHDFELFQGECQISHSSSQLKKGRSNDDDTGKISDVG